MILSTDETEDLNLGSWKGNPLDTHAVFINGMDVEDVVLYGEGVLDGQGDKSDWWQNCKVRARGVAAADALPQSLQERDRAGRDVPEFAVVELAAVFL